MRVQRIVTALGGETDLIMATSMEFDDRALKLDPEHLGAKTFTLTVNNTVRDTIGNALVAPYGQTFTTTGAGAVTVAHNYPFDLAFLTKEGYLS